MSKQKKSITSIKTKILTAVSALVLILVLILILLSYMISKNIIEDKSKQVLELSVKNQASQMEAWMTESLNVFNTFKENLETMDYTDEQIQTLLNSYLGKSSNYPDGFYIADSDGKVMQADGVEYKKTISDDPVWYTEGLTRVNMAFGDVFTNEAGDEVISASAILRNPDKIRVIAIDVPIAHIQVIVNSFISMDDAQAVLIDRSTMNILSQSEDSLSGSLSDDSGFLGTIGKKIDEQDYDSISLDNNIVEFREISGTNWVLVSYVPEASIFAELVSLRTTMAIVVVVILIILLVLMERMVNYMIKPIKSLTDSIVMMASGDFTVDIKTKGNDEITVMGQSMKDFAASMRKMINDIVNASETLQGQAESSSTVSGGLYEASLTQSKTIDNLN